MERYDSYKDSGVEWMNEIPSNWKKSRIRMVGDLYGGLTGKKGDDFNGEDNPSNKPFVPFTNIFNNTYISKDHFQYVNVEENENQNRVLKNDLFFLMSSESYDDLGKCSILLEDVEELYLNSFCKGFRIKDSNVYPLFLNYQLLGSLHKEMISVEGNGFTRINLRQDRLLDIPVFIPPFYEQQQIVSFLDIKTSLIDSLIEKTHRKIELLKEKRTSLINEVVTKGLNPNVEMKDSGIEWIGDIPSHWVILKLGYLGSFKSGNGFPENVQGKQQGDFPFFKVSDTNNHGNEKFMTNSNNYVSNDDLQNFKWNLFNTNTIVFPKIGMVLLNNKRRILNQPSFIDNNMMGFSTNDKINFKFSYYLLSLIDFKDYCSDGTIPSIGESQISPIKVGLPPLSEQQQIVEYLDEQTQIIDNTISIEEKRIELLKEYRQSLISEVVTGKRKVVE